MHVPLTIRCFSIKAWWNQNIFLSSREALSLHVQNVIHLEPNNDDGQNKKAMHQMEIK